MIKVVIFDFDGVLVDSNQAWADAFTTASKAAGLQKEVTYDDLRPHCGKPYLEVFRNAHPGAAGSKDVMDAMYSHFLRLATSDEFLKTFREIKGINGSLKRLKKRFRLAVGSGNSKKLLNRFLDKMGMSKYFDFVVAGDEVKKGKPNPDMLLKIINHFKVRADEAIYIGDASADIMAAKRANMRSVAVLTGALSREEAEELNPDFIVSDATQLQELLSCM